MIKIAICDDDMASLQSVSGLLAQLKVREHFESVTTLFSSSKELLELLRDGTKFDLFFLDVVMPDVDGIVLGKFISENMPQAKIIYFSSTREFAVESYMVSAFYYMLKPIKEDDFFKVVTKAICNIKSENLAPHYMKLGTTKGIVAVEFDRIEYCMIENRRVKYILSDGLNLESKVLRGSFDEEIAELISSYGFVKCSSHCVVNISKVKTIESDSIVMANEERIKVSRVYKASLNTAYFDYYFENLGDV